MRMTSLRIENFGIVRNAYIEFPTEPSLIYVRGVNKDAPHVSSNGSGKSTLLNAITWCLYECDTQGNKLASDAILDGAEYAEVGLVIEGGINAFIQRRRTNHPVGGSIVQLMVTTAKANPLVKEEAQRWIDATFGNPVSFIASHVYAYEDGFMSYALASDKQQKTLFDKLLGFDDLDDAYQSVAHKYSKLGAKVHKLQNQLIRLSTMWAMLKTAGGSNMGELQTALLSLELEEKEAREGVDAAEEGYRRAEMAYHEANDALIDFRSSLVPLEAVIEAQKAKVEAVKNQEECGVCGASLKGKDWKALLGRTYTEYRENITARKKMIGEFGDVEEHQEKVNMLRAAMLEASAVHKRLQENLSRISNSYNELHRRIGEMGGFNTSSRKQHVKQVMCSVKDSIAKHQKELDTLSFWKDGFGRNGIRAYRLDQITPRLNEVAALYSDSLFGDGTEVRYSTQTQLKSGEFRDRFSVELVKDERVLTRHSAGQAARRDLIHLLTIATVANEINPSSIQFIALDEAFRTIDAAGVYAAVELLRSLTPVFGTCIVVEHDQELASMFDREIVVTRENGAAHAVLQ